jgi:hypothetical protein
MSVLTGHARLLDQGRAGQVGELRGGVGLPLRGGSLAVDQLDRGAVGALGQRDRERDPEGRALAQGAAHRDVPAVEPDQLARQRQAQAGALGLALAAALGLVEALEDLGEVLLGDAAAGVLDGPPEEALLGAGADGDAAAVVGELHGIGHEVHEDGLDLLAVEVAVGQGVDALEDQLHAALGGVGAAALDLLADHRADVARRPIHLLHPALEPREVQDHVHLAQQAVRVGVHRLQQRARVAAVAALEQRVERAEDQHQRSAQLVAHVREEARLHLVRLGEAVVGLLELLVDLLQAQAQVEVLAPRALAGAGGPAGQHQRAAEEEHGEQGGDLGPVQQQVRTDVTGQDRRAHHRSELDRPRDEQAQQEHHQHVAEEVRAVEAVHQPGHGRDSQRAEQDLDEAGRDEVPAPGRGALVEQQGADRADHAEADGEEGGPGPLGHEPVQHREGQVEHHPRAEAEAQPVVEEIVGLLDEGALELFRGDLGEVLVLSFGHRGGWREGAGEAPGNGAPLRRGARFLDRQDRGQGLSQGIRPDGRYCFRPRRSPR